MPETHVKGLKELSRKLASMEAKVGGKTLRSAAMLATKPAIKAMQSAAPRGKKFHRTYKGTIAGPGYLSRSIKRISSYRNGKARIVIGVKKTAFYGVLFVEKGTKAHNIPNKRHRRRKKPLAFGGRVVQSVRHPGARARPWFVKSFKRSQKAMLRDLTKHLRRKIEKHAHG